MIFLSLLQLSFILTILPSLNGYQTLYLINYNSESTGCSVAANFYWKDQSLTKIQNCSDTSCSFTETGLSASVIIPPNLTDTELTFYFNIPSATVYSNIGIDITFISNSPEISLKLLNEPVITTSSSSPIYNIENEPGEVICPAYFSTPSHIYRATATSQSIISSEGAFTVTKSSPSQFIGIRSVTVWVDCQQGCNSCSTSTQCSACNGYFPAHTETIGGISYKTCETIQNCGTGCRRCYTQSGVTKCTICFAGYVLQSDVCVLNQIADPSVICDPKTQYINSEGVCMSYSTIGFYQVSASWLPFIISDPSVYKCQNQKQVLRFNRENYQLLTCSCSVGNCKICGLSVNCLVCINGYYHPDDQKSCIACSISHCMNCQDSYGTSCTKCMSGYYLSRTTPLSCELSPCAAGQVWNSVSSTCEECNTSHYINEYGECIAISCGDNEGFDTSTNLCVTCQPGQIVSQFVCVDIVCLDSEYVDLIINSCVSKTPNVGQINSSLTNDGYMIEIQFSSTLKVYVGLSDEQLINVQISSGQQVGYSYELVSTSENKIVFNLNPNVTFKSETIQVTLLDSQFVRLNNIQSNEYQGSLKTFVYLTENEKHTNEAIGTYSQVASTVIVSTILPIAIFSNFYVIINMIDLTAFLYYLLFIDVRLPDNVVSFFGFFQNFQFPFIPSLFESIISPDYVQEAPQKFIDNQYQPYFLSNSGQSVTIVLFILGVYVIGKLFSYVSIPKVQPYLVRAMRETWEFSAFFDLLWSLYIYILIGSLLQLKVYDFGEENYILNYSLHSIFGIIHILCPFLITAFLYKQKNLKSDTQFQQKYSTLVGGLVLFDETNPQSQILVNQSKQCDSPQLSSMNFKHISEFVTSISEGGEQNMLTRRQLHQVKLSKLYNGFLYLRKLIFGFIIVYGTSYPYFQLILISLLNLAMITYIFYILPIDSKHENIKNATGEIVMILIQLCVILLIDDDPTHSEDNRIQIGWIIVGLSGFIMLWNALQMIFETLKSIYQSIRRALTSKNKSNVHFESEIQEKMRMENPQVQPLQKRKTITKVTAKKEEILQFQPNQIESNAKSYNQTERVLQQFNSVSMLTSFKTKNQTLDSLKTVNQVEVKRRKRSNLKFIQMTNRMTSNLPFPYDLGIVPTGR